MRGKKMHCNHKLILISNNLCLTNFNSIMLRSYRHSCPDSMLTPLLEMHFILTTSSALSFPWAHLENLFLTFSQAGGEASQLLNHCVDTHSHGSSGNRERHTQKVTQEFKGLQAWDYLDLKKVESYR